MSWENPNQNTTPIIILTLFLSSLFLASFFGNGTIIHLFESINSFYYQYVNNAFSEFVPVYC